MGARAGGIAVGYGVPPPPHVTHFAVVPQKIETFVSSDIMSVERSCVPSCVEQVVGDKVTKCCHDKDLCNAAMVTMQAHVYACFSATLYSVYMAFFR